MTLRTVSGPTIAAALADARRLFGADAVMLQSTPPAAGQPASVTVAFDEAPAPKRPTPAAPARPEAAAPGTPRAYGYGDTRKVRPSTPAPASASAPSVPAPAPAPVSAAEVAELRARLAALEALLSQAPAAPPRPPSLVLVGPAGSGKSTLALRLGRTPTLLGAVAPAVIVVAPEDDGLFIDPASAFWGSGVPVAVVRTEADVRDALETFADADQILVDTPSLPLRADRARPFVERLATLLAPLAPLDVHFVADASRPATLDTEAVAALGLRPDALALTRLDEADAGAIAWVDRLGWPLHYTSAGTALADVAASERGPAVASVARPAASVPAASARAASSGRPNGSDYLASLLSAPAPAPAASAPARPEAAAGPTLVFAG